jgi:hypothetical protein
MYAHSGSMMLCFYTMMFIIRVIDNKEKKNSAPFTLETMQNIDGKNESYFFAATAFNNPPTSKNSLPEVILLSLLRS